jgi:hypothetical protein
VSFRSNRTPTASTVTKETARMIPLPRFFNRLVAVSLVAVATGLLLTATPALAAEPAFGVKAFDVSLTANPAGDIFTQAGGHPFDYTTQTDFNTFDDPDPYYGEGTPVEPVRDAYADLPPGLVGNPTSVGKCTLAELSEGTGSSNPTPLCPIDSQVGKARTELSFGLGFGTTLATSPLFNMEAPPGVPARFGYNAAGIPVIFDAQVRSDGDYGITSVFQKISEGITVVSATIDLWGVPADPIHDSERACSGEHNPFEGGPTCDASSAPAPFLRMPTSCTAPGQGLPFSLLADSWVHPGALGENGRPLPGDSSWKPAAMATHQAPGYPLEPGKWGEPTGTESCDQVPFEPTVDAQPTTNRADSSTGLTVDLGLPADCWDAKATSAEAEATICQSDMKEARVTLPQGLALNPAAASGRASCTPAQAGVTSPLGSDQVGFNQAPVSCPDASKLGSVEIRTPVLGEPLTGNVYLARQGDNPFKSLLAMYLVAEGEGVRVKQAGQVTLSPSGQLTTSFDQVPQVPFSDIHLDFYGGPRAALRTPGCGTYTTQTTLTPWSGNAAAHPSSTFQITQGCGGGFDPKLDAGAQNPLAGQTSPFNLRLSREDGSEEIAGLQATLPPGLVSSLRGYTYCPDSVLASISGEPGAGAAQEASPSCPASSRVGSVTVGAGAGVNPFYTVAGRAYLAGPYKGAPVSLAVIVPAVAGPFDLGSVLVRNAIYVDPTNAQLTIVSDPLPTILHGIPLDLRDVRVRYDQTLNPTSCEPMQITSQITSTQGASAARSVHFQAAGCDRLGFEPKLSLKLSGPTHRAAHPALRAVLTARPGDANIGNATVLLPRTELLENAHIRTICTRVQYAAGGGSGAGCPKGSVYGYARAWTPLLEQTLQGPVYLRANGGERELPDLVASLGGQIHIDLVGYIDSVHQRIRNRFATVPDAPVSKFELTMQGGGKGLLANNTDICKAKPRATAVLQAQNGRLQEMRPLAKGDCGGGKKGKRRR